MKNLNQVYCHLHSCSQLRYPCFELCPYCRRDAPHEAIVVESVVNYFSSKISDFSIETEYEIQMGSEKRRADIVFVFREQNAVIVECKREGSENGEDGIKQLKSYLCATDTPIGIFANTIYHSNWILFENLGRNKFSEITWDQFWTKVIDINPDSADAYYYRGMVKESLCNPELKMDYSNDTELKSEAIANYNRAIELKPDYADAYYQRGKAKDYLRKYDEAIADFGKVVELKPDYANAYYQRGSIKSKLGQKIEAITDFDIAIQLKPNDQQFHCFRGIAKAQLSLHSEAIADFDIAVKLKGLYANGSYFSRGKSKYELGKYTEAIADFDTYIHLVSRYHRPPDGYYYRGRAKAALGKFAEAIADYDKAIELKSNDAFMYICRGLTKFALGKKSDNLHKYDEAIADYDKAIELEPDNKMVYMLREITLTFVFEYALILEHTHG